MRPDLICIDAGSALGVYTGPTTRHILAGLSPIAGLRPELVSEAAHELHRYPRLADRLVRRICHRLLIDPTHWPDPWPQGGFEPYPETIAGLRQLAEIAPVVVASNISVTNLSRIDAIRLQLGEHLAQIYTSCELRARKPERRVWDAIAQRQGVNTSAIVHIGNDLVFDGHGALYAGARFLHLYRNDGHQAPALPAEANRAATITRLT